MKMFYFILIFSFFLYGCPKRKVYKPQQMTMQQKIDSVGRWIKDAPIDSIYKGYHIIELDTIFYTIIDEDAAEWTQ